MVAGHSSLSRERMGWVDGRTCCFLLIRGHVFFFCRPYQLKIL